MNPDELESLFRMAGGNPWSYYNTNSSVNGSIPLAVPLTNGKHHNLLLNDYLAQWNYQTLLFPKKTVELLAYFGFQNILAQGIKLTPTRSLDRLKRKCSRQVLRCWVLGAIGAGKSTLLRRFQLGDASSNEQLLKGNNEGSAVISPIIRAVEVGASEKYLVMEEISPNQVRALLHNEPKDYLANKLDLVILTYDAFDPNSFSYIAGLTVLFQYLFEFKSLIFLV